MRTESVFTAGLPDCLLQLKLQTGEGVFYSSAHHVTAVTDTGGLALIIPADDIEFVHAH